MCHINFSSFPPNLFVIWPIYFQNWYILYRFPTISPLIIPQQKNNESNLKSSKKLSQFDSNFSISDEVNQTPGCTDTIPLLCSVTGNNNSAGSGNTIANTNTTGGSTATLQSTNACLSKQLSLEDIIYKTSISQWDASMENINLDCISTISNWTRGALSFIGLKRLKVFNLKYRRWIKSNGMWCSIQIEHILPVNRFD